jgi:hypothetical protein
MTTQVVNIVEARIPTKCLQKIDTVVAKWSCDWLYRHGKLRWFLITISIPLVVVLSLVL